MKIGGFTYDREDYYPDITYCVSCDRALSDDLEVGENIGPDGEEYCESCYDEACQRELELKQEVANANA